MNSFSIDILQKCFDERCADFKNSTLHANTFYKMSTVIQLEVDREFQSQLM